MKIILLKTIIWYQNNIKANSKVGKLLLLDKFCAHIKLPLNFGLDLHQMKRATLKRKL